MERVREVHVYLAGACGQIGSGVYEIFRPLREVRNRYGETCRVVICGLIEWDFMVLTRGGLERRAARELIDIWRMPYDLEVIRHQISQHKYDRPDREIVFVDCTGREPATKLYADFLAAGIHVVTPSKLAFGGPEEQYLEIMRAAERGGGHLGIEAIFGAGVPTIHHTAGLLALGDRMKAVRCVCSGTNNGYLNALMEGMDPVSAIQELIRQKSAEPFARADLGGDDTRRKIELAFRIFGFGINPPVVSVEPLISQYVMRAQNAAEFIERLGEGYESELLARVQSARRNGIRLRHVSYVSAEGACARLEDVGPDDPLFALPGTMNMFLFSTDDYPDFSLRPGGFGSGGPNTSRVVAKNVFDVIGFVPAL